MGVSTRSKNKKSERKTIGGQLAIVNLQETEKDQFADLVIHAKTDEVMLQVAKYLDVKIPEYRRKDAFGVRYVAYIVNSNFTSAASGNDEAANTAFNGWKSYHNTSKVKTSGLFLGWRILTS